MSIQEIITITHEQLSSRQSSLFLPCEAVTSFSEDLESLITNLLETMNWFDSCVGLAAPQIGVLQRVAVIRARVVPADSDVVLVNPSIRESRGKKDGKSEICMSLPGVTGLVKRKPSVVVDYQDSEGGNHSIIAHDFFARVLQHEIDHLDGVLYPMNMRPQDQLLERRRDESETMQQRVGSD
jgi:peptide deformylase